MSRTTTERCSSFGRSATARPSGRDARTLALAGLLGGILVALPACSSSYKKLHEGGSATEVFFYDILGQDRSPSHYYQLIRDSHREKDFCYECTASDPYLVDKNIDAIERLGHAQFGRLEGMGEVVELMSEVIVEDRAALARSQAATTLTLIAVKLPTVASRGVPDDGRRLLQLMKDVDAWYAAGARGARAPKSYVVDKIRAIGDLEFKAIDFRFYRESVRFFYGRPFLVDERDPEIRGAIDPALTRRIAKLARVSLQAAVDDPSPQVRQDAIRGLKTLGDATAIPVVTERLGFETDWRVRMEALEYLGRVGTRPAVQALVPRLEDPDANVRHKARESLMRIAGADFGARRDAWEFWARQRDPTITFPGPQPDADASGVGAGAPVAGP